MFNIPNLLSFLRLLVIGPFCWAFLQGDRDVSYYYLAGILLVISGASDLLDGYLARLLNQETVLGKWLDPLADKLTLGAVVVCMWLRYAGEMPVLHVLFALLMLKELAMAVGGLILFHGQEVRPSEWWGKLGTGGFYVCMLGVIMVSFFAREEAWSDFAIVALVALSVALMIFAFIRYAILGVRILREKKNSEFGIRNSE